MTSGKRCDSPLSPSDQVGSQLAVTWPVGPVRRTTLLIVSLSHSMNNGPPWSSCSWYCGALRVAPASVTGSPSVSTVAGSTVTGAPAVRDRLIATASSLLRTVRTRRSHTSLRAAPGPNTAPAAAPS